MLSIFNTLSNKKEEFKTIKPGAVGMYTCGPSVYRRPHIGNYRTYVIEDLLKRYLIWKGLRVKHVMNITDVENKAVAEAKKLGIPLQKLTRAQESIFFTDMKKLNVVPASVYPRATDHIPEIVDAISELARKGFAYESKGDWFYDVSKYPGYGKLSRMKEKIPEGKRVTADDYFQNEAGDFVLWRAWKESDGGVFWESELGKGRPGWSIECTVLGRKYLGDVFDLKMGGADNIFCHHENEIAQAYGLTGKVFARYFVHPRHLLIDGKKMSKSLGNVVYLDEVEGRGFTPAVLRSFYLSAHYRKRLDFTWKGLAVQRARLDACRKCISGLRRVKWAGARSDAVGAEVLKARAGFEAALDDDLDAPGAIRTACALVGFSARRMARGTVSRADANVILTALAEFDSVLGLGFFPAPRARPRIR